MTIINATQRENYWKEYFEKESREIEAMKVRLSETYNLERNERFDIAWGIAWGFGHSYGLHEVEIYFGDLVPLIKV